MKQHFRSFLKFVREQGVVGLAIGFILGGAINRIVASLVFDVIQPAIALIFSSTQDLASLHYRTVMYGNFIANLINFLILAATVYLIFKVLRLEKLDLNKEESDRPDSSRLVRS